METLLDGGLDDKANADRMDDLIDDLTDLSLIETGAISLQLNEIDATEVVRAALVNLAPQAAGPTPRGWC